jgi:hypothetical protein
MFPELEVLNGFGTDDPFVQKYGNCCRNFAKPPKNNFIITYYKFKEYKNFLMFQRFDHKLRKLQLLRVGVNYKNSHP